MRDFRKQHKSRSIEILPNIEMQNKPIKSKSDVEYWKQTLCQT